MIEGDAVGAEPWHAGRLEQRARSPRGRGPAGRPRLPDHALERIGDVDVPGRIERKRVRAGSRPQLGEQGRRSVRGVDVQHLLCAEVDDEESVRLRMEVEA